MAVTGPQLRLERRTAEITTVDIAARMGVSRTTVWTIERTAFLSTVQVDKYRAALADAIKAAKGRVA